MRSPRLLLSLLLAVASTVSSRRGKGRGRGGARHTGGGFEEVECKRCMTQVMRLLTPNARGCADGNGTVIPSSSQTLVPTAFCDTLLPKKRQPVVYSFGVDSHWDFDKTMAIRGCQVVSFDPFCCGAARKLSDTQDYVPIGLASYDGLSFSDDPRRPNITFPVLTLKSIMEGYGHSKIDVLRMKISSVREWKTLKNLINTNGLDAIRQLSISIHMGDVYMWKEYRAILTSLKKVGFFPFYVAKQPDADYLKIQEGAQALYSRYEVSYGK